MTTPEINHLFAPDTTRGGGRMASIRTPWEEHIRYCTRPGGGGLGDMAVKVPVESIGMVYLHCFNREGDVRRCVHGRVMVGVDVPGSGGVYWVDLSPVFNPIRYRRAVKALIDG